MFFIQILNFWNFCKLRIKVRIDDVSEGNRISIFIITEYQGPSFFPSFLASSCVDDRRIFYLI